MDKSFRPDDLVTVTKHGQNVTMTYETLMGMLR